jgi:anti-sigma-K factor RskA
VTSSVDHQELHGRAAAYVLGALTPDERAEFRAHLSECAACAAEVLSFAPVVGALAHAAPPVDPPAVVRERVMSRVLQPLAQPVSTVSGPAAARALGPADELRKSRAPAAAGRSGLAQWLVAAASIAVAVGFGAYAVQLRGRVVALEQRLREITLRADASERQLAAVRQTAAEAQGLVVVLASSDLVRVELAGQAPAPQASGRAFWSRSNGLIFTASNLPPLPGGRTYQLWIVTPRVPVSAGLLKPGERGDVHAVFAPPRDVGTVAALAVTLEPEGGVPAPTGEKYLVGLAN